jgi:hypothetical protein
MKKVTRRDLLSLEEYESKRPSIRKRMIALKARRRAILPPHLSITFENTKTAWYQIQEMLRAERIVKSAAIRHELAVYNDLVPRPGELRATLLIEIADLHKTRSGLEPFLALPASNQLRLEIQTARGERISIPAQFDPDQYSNERISAVQYIRFRFDAAAIAAMRSRASRVAVVCDFPAHRGRVEVGAALRRELMADLRGTALRRASVKSPKTSGRRRARR